MSSTHTKINCAICGDLVHSHDWKNDYEGRIYNRVTHKPYEERRIEVPEKFDSSFYICTDCFDNTVAIKELIKNKRLQWYDKKIKEKQRDIERNEASIKSLKEGIPILEDKIEELKIEKNKILMVD